MRSGHGFLNDMLPVPDCTAQVTQPALVIASRTDRSVPFAHAESLAAAMPRAELVASQADGHMIWFGPDYPAIAQKIRGTPRHGLSIHPILRPCGGTPRPGRLRRERQPVIARFPGSMRRPGRQPPVGRPTPAACTCLASLNMTAAPAADLGTVIFDGRRIPVPASSKLGRYPVEDRVHRRARVGAMASGGTNAPWPEIANGAFKEPERPALEAENDELSELAVLSGRVVMSHPVTGCSPALEDLDGEKPLAIVSLGFTTSSGGGHEPEPGTPGVQFAI